MTSSHVLELVQGKTIAAVCYLPENKNYHRNPEKDFVGNLCYFKEVLLLLLLSHLSRV